jgi:single-strand DNA-binding protein
MLTLTAIGNLGDDAELKVTDSGYQYVKFRMAAKSHKNDDPVWLSVAYFGKGAIAIADYLRKGTQVYVSGGYKVRTFQTHAGEERPSHDVKADTVELLSRSTREEPADDLPF